MTKSSLIIAPITLIIVLLAGLLNNICCLFSPIVAVLFGLAAGALCVYFERPADTEKSAVRGAIAGAIAGLAALIGQTIGEAIALVIAGSGQTPVACLPGLCDRASAPTSQTSWILSSFFTSCFCGLILLAVMAGLGAAGGMIFYRLVQNKIPGQLPGPGVNPTA